MDITQIHKLIEDYKAASGEYPGSILVPPDVQHRLNQYAVDCNEKSPITTLMGVPVVVDFFAPPGTVYVGIGKIPERETHDKQFMVLKQLIEEYDRLHPQHHFRKMPDKDEYVCTYCGCAIKGCDARLLSQEKLREVFGDCDNDQPHV